MKTILLATDGSPSAARALDVAARLAADSQGELAILAIMQSPRKQDLKTSGQREKPTADEILEQEAAAILSRAEARVADFGIKGVKTLSRNGDPAEVILAAAKELRADVIVLGKRGRGRLEGLLLGSVSQKIVSLAPCPVMTVP